MELAAQTWVLVSSLDDWLACQPSLVTKKRQLLPVVAQRQLLVDTLARLLDKLGLRRPLPDPGVAPEPHLRGSDAPRRRYSAPSRPSARRRLRWK